jgi:hypothetical protein
MVKKEKIAIPPKLDSERPPPILPPAPTSPPLPDKEMGTIRCYDLRNEQPDPPQLAEQKHRILKGEVVKRSMSSITGVVIHQTATPYGVSEAAIKAAGGNKELAKAKRALNVACHGLAFRDGFYALPNPLSWYVWHANALNEGTLGLEVEGLYSGLKDNLTTLPDEAANTTWGSKPMEVTDLVVESARACLKHIVEEARSLGAPMQFIYAHRQSSPTRQSDPGQELWERVVLEYAVPVLGLKTNPRFTIGGGRMIPKSWDPDGMGSY